MLAQELYVTARHDAASRAVARDWQVRTTGSLARHLEPDAALAVEALAKGLLVLSTVSPDPLTRDQIRWAVNRVAGWT